MKEQRQSTKQCASIVPQALATYKPEFNIALDWREAKPYKDLINSLRKTERFQSFAWELLRRNRAYQQFCDGNLVDAKGEPLEESNELLTRGLLHKKHYREPYRKEGVPFKEVWSPLRPLYIEAPPPVSRDRLFEKELKRNQVAVVFDLNPLTTNATALPLQLKYLENELLKRIKPVEKGDEPGAKAETFDKYLRIADALSADTRPTSEELFDSISPDAVDELKEEFMRQDKQKKLSAMREKVLQLIYENGYRSMILMKNPGV